MKGYRSTFHSEPQILRLGIWLLTVKKVAVYGSVYLDDSVEYKPVPNRKYTRLLPTYWFIILHCYKVSYNKNKDCIIYAYNCCISTYTTIICVLYNICYKAPYKDSINHADSYMTSALTTL